MEDQYYILEVQMEVLDAFEISMVVPLGLMVDIDHFLFLATLMEVVTMVISLMACDQTDWLVIYTRVVFVPIVREAAYEVLLDHYSDYGGRHD